MVVLSLAALLPAAGSWREDTVALAVTVLAEAGAVTAHTIVDEAPDTTSARAHVSVCPDCAQAHPDAVAVPPTAPAVSVMLTDTSYAALGPSFFTVVV